MRWVLIIGAGLVGLALLLVVVGMMRPRGHTARTQATYAKTTDELWAVLADYDHWSQWNPGIKSVTPLPDRNGHRAINVEASWGVADTEITAWEPSKLLRTDMDAGAFRGSWTYELAPAGNNTTVLTITENGEVLNPLFRALMIFNDNHATMMAFHRGLAKRLGTNVEPRTL
jgi:hypothetical protein